MMSQSEPEETRFILCCTMMSFSWERTSRTCRKTPGTECGSVKTERRVSVWSRRTPGGRAREAASVWPCAWPSCGWSDRCTKCWNNCCSSTACTRWGRWGGRSLGWRTSPSPDRSPLHDPADMLRLFFCYGRVNNLEIAHNCCRAAVIGLANAVAQKYIFVIYCNHWTIQ